jgi:hypothetical protein
VINNNAYDTVVQSIADPEPERSLGEEHVLFTKHIELRIPIQYSCGHELVKDPDDKRREDVKSNIV